MRAARNEMGLTQQRLSDMCHVSIREIAKIENGEMNPSFLILKAIIQVLGNCSSRVSYDYTQEEVQKIIDELDYQLKHLKERFSGKRTFSLSSSEEPDEQ